MSALRDIRILVARQLEAPQNVRARVMDILNLLDADLDAQGYAEPSEITEALRALDRAIILDDDDVLIDDDFSLDDEDDIDETDPLSGSVDIGEFPNIPANDDDVDD